MKSKNKTFWIGLAGGLMLAAPMFAQPAATFRAQIRGGGDHGKCTIEVDVDGVAEIEIQGDQGRMRTISGNPAGWRRMVCNEPMPQNPQGFRFSGVDGRGRQTLLRDPSSNRGVAVVRIEDPQGGHEGYTFDIEWRGAGGGAALVAVTAGAIGVSTGAAIEVAMTVGSAETATAGGTTKSASLDAATATSIIFGAPMTGWAIAKSRWTAAAKSASRSRPSAVRN